MAETSRHVLIRRTLTVTLLAAGLIFLAVPLFAQRTTPGEVASDTSVFRAGEGFLFVFDVDRAGRVTGVTGLPQDLDRPVEVYRRNEEDRG